jgi:flavodoxin
MDLKRNGSGASTKVLVVYFSRTGSTREIAGQIHERIGGDLLEIQTVDPYPADYDAVTRQAKEELKSGYKPPLKTRVENIGDYDLVFIGSPNWWSTISAPVKAFLSEYDFSGKTIAPFITHLGSGLGRSVADVKALCPTSKVMDGLAVFGEKTKTAPNEVAAWLNKLGVDP